MCYHCNKNYWISFFSEIINSKNYIWQNLSEEKYYALFQQADTNVHTVNISVTALCNNLCEWINGHPLWPFIHPIWLHVIIIYRQVWKMKVLEHLKQRGPIKKKTLSSQCCQSDLRTSNCFQHVQQVSGMFDSRRSFPVPAITCGDLHHKTHYINIDTAS